MYFWHMYFLTMYFLHIFINTTGEFIKHREGSMRRNWWIIVLFSLYPCHPLSAVENTTFTQHFCCVKWILPGLFWPEVKILFNNINQGLYVVLPGLISVSSESGYMASCKIIHQVHVLVKNGTQVPSQNFNTFNGTFTKHSKHTKRFGNMTV